MFVIAPLHAMGIFAFQGFAIVALLGIIAGMIVISEHPVALAVMSVCFAANVAVFLVRLFYPHGHIMSCPWLPHGSSSRSRSERWSHKLYSEVAASPIIELSARSCCICLSRSPLSALSSYAVGEACNPRIKP
jgi:hypothetical protein